MSTSLFGTLESPEIDEAHEAFEIKRRLSPEQKMWAMGLRILVKDVLRPKADELHREAYYMIMSDDYHVGSFVFMLDVVFPTWELVDASKTYIRKLATGEIRRASSDFSLPRGNRKRKRPEVFNPLASENAPNNGPLGKRRKLGS